MDNLSLQLLYDQLNQRQTTSVELVTACLTRIQRYDSSLHALAAVHPDALQLAQQLDDERQQLGPRSLLHGIPIVVKDNIQTADGLPTTVNSFAMANFYPREDAQLIRQLRQAGAIILGKANLSEWAYFMSDDHMPSGYGSMHGQVVNPYGHSIDPYGSSTGSAVAVAAGYVPIAIGTETNGSLMAPAYQTSSVALKPTWGRISGEGIVPLALTQDTAGPMATSVENCAILMHYLQASSQPQEDFLSAIHLPIHGRRIGIVKLRSYSYCEEELAILNEAKKVLSSQGVHLEFFDMVDQEMDNYPTLLIEFKHDLNAYLAAHREEGAIGSLDELIEFNRTHAERCLRYGQSILLKANQTTGNLSDSTYLEQREKLLQEANRFEVMMNANQWDAIVSTQWLSYAPIAGNPSIVVPAKALRDTTPRSLVFVGKKGADCQLIALAHAYEQATRHRIAPNLDRLIESLATND